MYYVLAVLQVRQFCVIESVYNEELLHGSLYAPKHRLHAVENHSRLKYVASPY